MKVIYKATECNFFYNFPHFSITFLVALLPRYQCFHCTGYMCHTESIIIPSPTDGCSKAEKRGLAALLQISNKSYEEEESNNIVHKESKKTVKILIYDEA